MKNLKIALKLGLAFGAMVVIIVVLGGMAISQMNYVSRNVDSLPTEDITMLRASLEAEKAMHLARFDFLTYSLTAQESHRAAGLLNLDAAQTHLREAAELIGRFPRLAAMRKNVNAALEKSKEYRDLVAETAAQTKAIRQFRDKQDEAAKTFMDAAYKYLIEQSNKLHDEIQTIGAVTNHTEQTAALQKRAAKIKLINDVIDAGNRLRIANWKSQTLRDHKIAKAAMQDFDIIDKTLSEIAPSTSRENVVEVLDHIKLAAQQYKAAMLELTEADTIMQDLGRRRGDVSTAAVAASERNAAESIEHAMDVAMQSASHLGHASDVMFAGILVAILLAVVITVLLTRGITRAIRKAVAFVNEIARGNFSERIDVDSNDELGALCGAMNRVAESLQTQVGEIQEAAKGLGASASQILGSVTAVTTGAQETATAVTETTATVEQVKQGSHLTSQKAKAVSESAQRGFQTAHAGQEATETVAEGMGRINEQMTSIAETIMKLGEQSQAIGEIISTVDDIAEQSNLLAVNAAVEAARAGEHGKGFAVVAQEIKSMAEQSKQATRQVRAILSEIQKATGAAVMATEQGGKAVEKGLKEAYDANKSIQVLSDSFTETVQSAGQIAVSTQEQLTGMDQVAMAMESIKDATQQNVESMVQLQNAAKLLKDIEFRLSESVARFTI